MARYLGPSRASSKAHRRVALAAAALGTTVLVVAGCSSSESTSTPSVSPSFSPDVNSFSGEPPSAIASAKSSLLESVSAAAASASAAASSFEASVSAQLAAGRAEAEAVLAKTEGTGNAMNEVTITGLPKAQAAGFNAALITVVNRSGAQASYAIKVEFLDDSGKVVDTTFLNIKDVAAGATATATAFTPMSRDTALVSRVAQAQRY
ncbi:FxLYD domain-containing protein [Kitasatospora sp. NPDC004240]